MDWAEEGRQMRPLAPAQRYACPYCPGESFEHFDGVYGLVEHCVARHPAIHGLSPTGSAVEA